MSETRDPDLLTYLRLDDITLGKKSILLPAMLREPFLWLASFCRDECAADAGVLETKFREVGVHRDKTTWIRLLKGQYNHNPNGTNRESPLIAEDKLLEEIDALQKGVRIETMRGRVPFVMTSTARSIFQYIDLKKAIDTVNKFGVAIGPTGSQKTATFKEFERQRNHGAVKWLEAPENGNLGEFIHILARRFGGPEREAYDRRRSRIFASARKNTCLIIDNAQRLYRTEGKDQTAFNLLLRLQDECQCAVILSITPTFEGTLRTGMMKGYFEQFIGRAGGFKNLLRLPEFAPDEDILAIAKAFELAEPRKHLRDLAAISREPGRIRILFEALQRGKQLATSEKKPFTIDHIRAVHSEEE